MKNDLISRAAAIDAAIDGADDWDGGYNPERERYIREHIAQLPAVDAAPVVHGRWIDIPDKPEWDQKMCSVCGDYFCCQDNYCPNCGAKMDGDNS